MNAKPETRNWKNAYTDAPELDPNLIVGALQLLFWLFFHPSAWRNHIVHIDPTLRPDFTLVELNRVRWRSPALRRLLIMGYVVMPLLAGLLASLVLWVTGRTTEVIALSIVFGVIFGIVGGIVGSLVVNVAVGGVLGSFIFTIVFSTALVMIFDIANGVTLNVKVICVEFGVLVGLVGGIVGSIVSNVPYGRRVYSLVRQIGGVAVGIFIGSMTLLIGSSLASKMTHPATVGMVGGIVAGVAVSLTVRWRRGVTTGLAVGTPVGVAVGVVAGLAFAIGGDAAFGGAFALLSVTLVALPYILAERIAGPWAAVLASMLGGGGGWIALVIMANKAPLWPNLLLSLLSILLGLILAWWWFVWLYPFLAVWNTLLQRADERRAGGGLSLLRWHSAFWDEHQRLRLSSLDDYLLLVMERNPAEGQAAMEYLATGHQRWAAQAAQIELDARELEHCGDVEAIGYAHRGLAVGELEGPASALLRSFSRISQDVDAALRQESDFNRRLALNAVEDRLDGLLRELTRSGDRYAARFRPIANYWRQTVADHAHELAQTVEQRQEIDSPYVIGVPLTAQQEIFVGRTDISARIEGLLLDRRRPPLLLYGQRRMGKTSLLNNLGRLLPSTIVPLFVDLQGPASQASDYAGFLYNIARGMADSAQRQRELTLPLLAREALAADPFTRFDEWLDEVERALGGNTALLALDEFEALDSAITKGRFDEEALLGTLRHLIQHRPRFKVLLTGSHILDELQRWASYLINVQVVHISYLNEAEARQLIERPVQDFALRYEPDASQRVLDLTRGHPFLVQLLCAEIVALKNEQDPAVRRLARLADVEAAVPEALRHGSFFFADIQQNQADADALALLRFLAAQGEKAVVSREDLARQLPDPDGLDQALTPLTRRELIEAVGGGYRFQVELIRRWFAQQVK
jgi:hypothetical protein